MNTNFKKQQSGSGIAGMILGIMAILLSCVFVGGFIGFIGFILSIIGLTQRDKSGGTAVVGIIFNSIAVLIAIIFFVIILGSNLQKNKKVESTDSTEYAEQSILAKTMELNPTQETAVLKIFEACGIGEIVSASRVQAGEEHTSYHLKDKETNAYKGAEYAFVVWVDNASKTVESIYFHSQSIYIDGEVLSPVTDYYVNSEDRSKYRVASQLAVQQLLSYPDSAKFPAISGWAFGVEDGTIIVQSSVTAKNAFNMESKMTFQVKFVSGNITSLILDGEEYIRQNN